MSPYLHAPWRPRAAAALLLIAAALHTAVIGEHLSEWFLAGVFFTALAAGELTLAVMVLKRPNSRVLKLVVIASAATVGLWVISRTVGLPFGPEPYRAEAVGLIDTMSAAAEVLTVLALVRLRRRARLGPIAVTLALVTAACGSSGAASRPASTRSTGATREVVIDTFAFAPKQLTVAVGTTVVWTNHDDITHTVSSGTRDYDPTNSGVVVATHKSGLFDMPLAGKSTTFRYTFKNAGAYHYFCDRHPGMEADVQVA